VPALDVSGVEGAVMIRPSRSPSTATTPLAFRWAAQRGEVLLLFVSGPGREPFPPVFGPHGCILWQLGTIVKSTKLAYTSLTVAKDLVNMLAIMAERPRLIIDCPELIRRAVRIRVGKEDSSISEVVIKAIRQAFPDEIAEAEQHLEKERKRKGKDH
jgi:hypothetical protein